MFFFLNEGCFFLEFFYLWLLGINPLLDVEYVDWFVLQSVFLVIACFVSWYLLVIFLWFSLMLWFSESKSKEMRFWRWMARTDDWWMVGMRSSLHVFVFVFNLLLLKMVFHVFVLVLRVCFACLCVSWYDNDIFMEQILILINALHDVACSPIKFLCLNFAYRDRDMGRYRVRTKKVMTSQTIVILTYWRGKRQELNQPV